jgi:hypothetical protein
MNNPRLQLVLFSALLAAPLAHASDPVKLTKEETQQALSGKSITYSARGTTVTSIFAPDGKLTVRPMSAARLSTGTWTVDDEGRFCVKIISGTAGDSCRHLVKTDTGYAMTTAQGGGMIVIEKME